MRSEVAMSVNVLCGGRNHRHEVPKEGAKKKKKLMKKLKINRLIYNTLNIDPKSCHT